MWPQKRGRNNHRHRAQAPAGKRSERSWGLIGLGGRREPALRDLTAEIPSQRKIGADGRHQRREKQPCGIIQKIDPEIVGDNNIDRITDDQRGNQIRDIEHGKENGRGASPGKLRSIRQTSGVRINTAASLVNSAPVSTPAQTARKRAAARHHPPIASPSAEAGQRVPPVGRHV